MGAEHSGPLRHQPIQWVEHEVDIRPESYGLDSFWCFGHRVVGNRIIFVMQSMTYDGHPRAGERHEVEHPVRLR